MTKSITKVEDLSEPDLELLAQVLHYSPSQFPSTGSSRKPSQSWLSSQSSLLSQSDYPTHLLRPRGLHPSNFIPQLALALPNSWTPPWTPRKAILCSTHKVLNPYLMRRLFLQIGAECGVRLSRLAEFDFSSRGRPERKVVMSPEARGWLHRMQGVNGLWMRKRAFQAAFPHLAEAKGGEGVREEYISEQCEACILSFVGGNAQIVSDLRTSLIGRRKRTQQHDDMLLWPLIAAWTGWSGEADEIRQRSEELGGRIRHLRKKLQKQRRGRRGRRGGHDQGERRGRRGKQDQEERLDHLVSERPKINPDHPEPPEQKTKGIAQLDGPHVIKDEEPEEVAEGRGEAEEHDFEGSIIAYYSNLLSTTTLIPADDRRAPPAATEDEEEAIHPAFRDSLIFDNATGTFRHPEVRPSSLGPAGSSSHAHQPSPRHQASTRHNNNPFTKNHPARHHPGRYSDTSIYSQSTCHGGPKPNPIPQQAAPAPTTQQEQQELHRIANKRAEAYRILIRGSSTSASTSYGYSDAHGAVAVAGARRESDAVGDVGCYAVEWVL